MKPALTLYDILLPLSFIPCIRKFSSSFPIGNVIVIYIVERRRPVVNCGDVYNAVLFFEVDICKGFGGEGEGGRERRGERYLYRWSKWHPVSMANEGWIVWYAVAVGIHFMLIHLAFLKYGGSFSLLEFRLGLSRTHRREWWVLWRRFHESQPICH